MKKCFSLVFLLFSLTLGSTPICYNYQIYEACEFVLDSYKIKQGKFSILEMEGRCFPPLSPSALLEYEDRIDEDDILKITLFHPTRNDLANSVNDLGAKIGYRVTNGKIRLPCLDPVEVKGLTLDQARLLLEKLYTNEIAHTEIFIDYAARNHSKVQLAGAVEKTEIPVNGRIRLFEVLSMAAVSPEANLFKSYVSREGELLPVDMYQLVHEGDMSQNIVMHPKDKIYIAAPTESSIIVLGEVGTPRIIPIVSGMLTLREAIALAGGIPYTGDKHCIQVIRGNILCPKIYKLSWKHITYLPNDSLLLMPGDTIYISEKPITQWNRFIEQLLPSSLLIDLGMKTRGVFN